MASLTQKRKTILNRKKVKEGRIRKRAASQASTPRFPVHVETAPDAVLPMPAGTAPEEKR